MALRRAPAPADWLVVGLGNPGDRYERTPHNVGFEVARELIARWDLGRPRKRFDGLLAQGRGPDGVSVAVLIPQTYMNESGRCVGPARGALKVEPAHVLVAHDELDLPFGEIRARLGGGLAGHNGLKSVRAGLGTADFARLRIGIGRPDSTDPEIVSAHVLGRWRQSPEDVQTLVREAVFTAEQIVLGEREL